MEQLDCICLLKAWTVYSFIHSVNNIKGPIIFLAPGRRQKGTEVVQRKQCKNVISSYMR